MQAHRVNALLCGRLNDMLLLALDTCDSRGSVAILQDDSVLQLQAHDSAEDYSSWLLKAVQAVMDQQHLSLADLSLFAVASGPGSFTGVRVGLTTVKAWSEVCDKPIAAVSRLQALRTYSYSRSPFVAVFADAQRSQVFGALYRGQPNALEQIDQELVTPPAQFVDWVAATAGQDRVEWISPDPKCIAQTAQWSTRMALGESIQVISPVLAPAIGRLGLRLARENRLTDALHLDANYVRRSDAELFWKGAASAH